MTDWEWSYPSATGDYLVTEVGDDCLVAVVVCTGDERGGRQRDLIVAAPKLLAALEELMTVLHALAANHAEIVGPVTSEAYVQAREAIAQARGEK